MAVVLCQIRDQFQARLLQYNDPVQPESMEMDQEDQEESGPIGYYDVEEASQPEEESDDHPYRTARQGGHFTQSEVDDRESRNTFVYERKEATAMAVVLCQIRDRFQARSLQLTVYKEV